MALGDKVEELQRATTIIGERMDNALKALDAFIEAQKETARELADFRREHEKEVALLKREADDFRKWKDDQKKERDESSRRLWAFGPNALGALISGLISALVAYLVAYR